MNDKTEQSLADELRRAAKLAAPYAVAMIGASHLNKAADNIDALIAARHIFGLKGGEL